MGNMNINVHEVSNSGRIKVFCEIKHDDVVLDTRSIRALRTTSFASGWTSKTEAIEISMDNGEVYLVQDPKRAVRNSIIDIRTSVKPSWIATCRSLAKKRKTRG